MPTQEQYEKLHEDLGKKYRCSPRVIQYIRSSYYQKYKGMPYEEVKREMIDHCEKVLVEIMKTYRQVKIDFASLVLKDVQGLRHAGQRIEKLHSEMRHIVGSTDKVGLRRSIINTIRHCNELDLKDILETKMEE